MLETRQAADELMHRPIELTTDEQRRFASDVVFVGVWMPERGPFLLRLIERGVPLRIFGGRWSKAPEFSRLGPHVVEGDLKSMDYVKAIRAASIAIGLTSKGNADLYTTRSLEIPAIGTLFCAERTPAHLAMYEDGVEAVFWKDADDCADQCLALLQDRALIQRIAAAGHARVHANGDFNEKFAGKVLRCLNEHMASV